MAKPGGLLFTFVMTNLSNLCQTAICQTYRLLIIYSPGQTCELDQIN